MVRFYFGRVEKHWSKSKRKSRGMILKMKKIQQGLIRKEKRGRRKSSAMFLHLKVTMKILIMTMKLKLEQEANSVRWLKLKKIIGK